MKNKKIIGVLMAVVAFISGLVAYNSVLSDQLMTDVTATSTADILGKSGATRVEVARLLATMVANATGEDLSDNIGCVSDVKSGDKYENAICFLVNKGMFLPFDNNKFKPKTVITREEAAQVFFVAYDYLVSEGVLKSRAEPLVCRKVGNCMYTDVKESDGFSYVVSVVTDLKIVDVKPWTRTSKFNASKIFTKDAAKVWSKNFAKLLKTK